MDELKKSREPNETFLLQNIDKRVSVSLVPPRLDGPLHRPLSVKIETVTEIVDVDDGSELGCSSRNASVRLDSDHDSNNDARAV